ncbi:MAG: glycosyltransferase family A protein, partial [Candidatus Nanopelagicales bacterium]
ELRRATDPAFRWCGGCSDHVPGVKASPDVPMVRDSTPIVRGTFPVAIIITCHNYARVLAECVESALATGPSEVLIVDDASDDDTPAVAAQFADRGVRYLRVENRNVYRTRLDGLAQTAGQRLAVPKVRSRLSVSTT